MNAVRTRPRPGARAALNLGQQRWLLEGVRKAALRAGHTASVRHLDAALLAVQAAEALAQPAEPPPPNTGALVHTIWVVLSAIAEQEAGNAVGRTALNLRLRAFPSGLEAHLCAPPFLRLQLDARLVARLRAVRHDPVVEAHELGELADDLFLSSVRAIPRKLTETGFTFQDTEAEAAFTRLIQEIDGMP